MTSKSNGQTWYEDYVDYDDIDNDISVTDYDVSASPNDFNVSTLYNFMESGAIIIPGFQRNYVWDVKRASKLIESLILGLPVPQLFLYEESRNRFLVIDGQQRLMSIYYFIKQRFPRKTVRPELRRLFEENRSIPDHVLQNDKYFTNFRLRLPDKLPSQPNPLSGLSYATLGDHKFQLDLRPIRNVVIKQNSPGDDDSSIYEIFSRLNSGGVNLAPQEIRLSLYHSDFYDVLLRMNTDSRWRSIVGSDEPDLHLKDVEVLLRIFAMLIDAENYAPSMVKFLNQFSRKCQTHNQEQNLYLGQLFDSFLNATVKLPRDAFLNRNTTRFNIALIEAVFNAACYKAFLDRRPIEGLLVASELNELKVDTEFAQAASFGTTRTSNVHTRLDRGKVFIQAL